MSQLIKETVTQIGQELFRRSDMSLDRWPRDLSEISRNVAGKFFAHPVSSRCLACGPLHGFLDFPMGKVTFPDELTEQTRQPSHRECPQDAWISEKPKGFADLPDLLFSYLSIVTCTCMSTTTWNCPAPWKSDLVGLNLAEDNAQTKPQIKPKSSRIMRMFHTTAKFHDSSFLGR